MIEMRDVPTVEAEVTASHVCGRRCTEINRRNFLSSVIDSCKETIVHAMEEQIAIVIEMRDVAANCRGRGHC